MDLVDYYCPALFLLGTAVRSCTWDGREPNGGKLAKEILQRCLLLLVHIFDDYGAKVEYVRTLAVALLSWTPWMDKLPGCVFVEESCEALLSRMATRCIGHYTVSSFDGVSDLYQTLPPPSMLPKATRGTLRAGLLSLFWSRCRRIISNSPALPFAAWHSKGCTFQDEFPVDFTFPSPLVSMDEAKLLPVFQCAVRSLRSKAKLSQEVLDFFESKVPKASPNIDLQEAIRRVPRVRGSRPVRPTLFSK